MFLCIHFPHALWLATYLHVQYSHNSSQKKYCRHAETILTLVPKVEYKLNTSIHKKPTNYLVSN